MESTPTEVRELVTIMLAGDERFAHRCLNESDAPLELAWELLRMFTRSLHVNARGSDAQTIWAKALLEEQARRISA